MRIAAFATIKMNSQRVPQKNTQMIGSKPLCYHILDAALKVDLIDDVYVYCSDANVIRYIPQGAKFIQRETWLDGDEIRAKDTYTAFLKDVDADVYIAMCTTSPFTKSDTIKNALNKVVHEGYDSAFTVRRLQTFAWYENKPINYDLAEVPRTQDMEPVFIETSAFFIFRKELWLEHGRRIGFKPYMQEVDEIEAVDIDTVDDLRFAQIIGEKVLNL